MIALTFPSLFFSNVDICIGCNQETGSNIGYLYWLQSRSGSGSNIGGGPDDGAVPKSHAYTNTSTALINDASEWTFLRGKIYLWWCWEVSVLKWFTFCSNTTISPNIFHFLCKIASIPLCRIEMKTWWHTGNWIGTNFIRYPISDAKCPHLSNPPSRTCWCHATTQSDRIKCNRIFSRSLGYRWE